MNEYGIRQPQGFPDLPSDWTTESDSFLAADEKSRLFGLFWRKSGSDFPKKILVVCHGFGEHCGRYLHFPYYLQNSVDAVYAYDQRGHGRSDGLRGDADSFDSLVSDLALVIQRMHERFPGAQVHLLGHSMGGHVALRLGFFHPDLPLASFQVSAPFLALFEEPPVPLRAVASVLARTWGTLELSADVDPKVISRDPAVMENYAVDRLNHAKMTPRFYHSMKKAQKDTLSRKAGFAYPLAMHIPLDDRLVDEKVARRFFDALDCAGKKLFEYADFRHEPMNEIGKEKFFDAMASVIDAG